MKKPQMLIILISITTGIFIGYISRTGHINGNDIKNKDKLIYKNIKVTDKNIKNLSKEKINLDKELSSIKADYLNSNQIKVIEDLKKHLSYNYIEGRGLQIQVDAVNDTVGNIANLVGYNNILINLVNDLKSNGATYIAINENRINQYTSIILAGNHININSISIAPPYKIEAVGNEDSLKEYSSYYIENLQKNYPLSISISEVKNIKLPRVETENKFNYIKGE